jgi:hypothetical protein
MRNVIASIAVSGFGTWSYNVGIAVYAYEKTHSAVWVAVVTVGRYVPAIVLNWWAAALVDRLPRRGLVICADLGCAAIMVLLAGLGAASAPVWSITIVAALSSTAARVQAAAVLALAADVVVESQLARASVLASASEAVATAAGSAAASALLLRFAPSDLFLLNAVTFVFSAILIAKVRPVAVRRAQPAPAIARDDDSAATRSRIWPLQATRSLAAYVYGMDVVLLAVVASRQLHSGTSGYGWLLAAAGVGGLIAIVPTRKRVGGANAATMASGGLVLYSLPLLFFALAPPFGGGLAVEVFRGAGAVLCTSSVMGALQWAVPSASAGRVFGSTQSLVLAGTCVGSIMTAVLLGTAGFTATIVIGALAPCLVQLVLFPFLRRFDRQDANLIATLDPRLATLRSLDLLHDASRSTLYDIADSIQEIVAPPGTVIVAEGDDSDALYVLTAGRVEVSAAASAGSVVLRTMSAPAYFGEIGLLRRVPRTATVTALQTCELWQIRGDRFLAAVSEAGVSGALLDTIQIRFDTGRAEVPQQESADH